METEQEDEAMSDPTEIIAALHDLLDQEGKLVRLADFANLPRHSTRKDQLIGKLELAHATDAAALKGLRDHAARTAGLMMAAIRGVHAARRRFDQLQRVQSSLNTYDSRGRRSDVALDDTTVERRV